jgi:molybdopterin-biosynthesis enzyme MoeA-like protein
VRLGLEPALISIVGDDELELERALAEGFRADLCIVTGGLGPTHDDRTVELVARAAGVPLRLDDGLHAEIERISRAIAERLHRPYADFESGRGEAGDAARGGGLARACRNGARARAPGG